MLAAQVLGYYIDLQHEDMKTDLAIVHSRFSTNTFPSWDRAQPLPVISHNGEINTVRGNTNWMKSRQRSMDYEAKLGVKRADADFLNVPSNLSDSGVFDATVSMLVASGKSLPEAMLMMVPEAWQEDSRMPQNKDFYECVLHSLLLVMRLLRSCVECRRRLTVAPAWFVHPSGTSTGV